MGNDEAKLFVAGLPDSISEEVLKQLFEATGGKVLNVSLPKDRMTGRPRGFGFVTLSTPAEAQAARDALDGSMQAGKSISVRPFQAEPPRRDGGGPGSGPRPGGFQRNQNAPDRTLYVGNLPYDCTQQEVEALFTGVAEGQVVRIHLPTDADGRKRFGFVTMASAETAKSAAESLQAAQIRGRRLVVNLAHPKGERPPRSDGGGYGGGGYGGGGGFGGGGYSGGFPPANFGGPPTQRKTFDERRRGKGGPGKPNEDGGQPRPKRREREDHRHKDDDWSDDE